MREQDDTSKMSFGLLAEELLLVILSYLDVKSLCITSAVSRTWFRLTHDNDLWRNLVENHFSNNFIPKNSTINYKELYKEKESICYDTQKQGKKGFLEKYLFSSAEKFNSKKLLVRAIKNNDLRIFKKILEIHFLGLEEMYNLLRFTYYDTVLDDSTTSAFHWLGKLDRQLMKDAYFSQLLTLTYKRWEAEDINLPGTYFLKNPIPLSQIAAICNQVEYLREHGDEEMRGSTRPFYFFHPFLLACLYNSYEVVVFYIEEKKVAKDFSHFTAGNGILSAARRGSEKLLTYLVAHDLDVNYQNASGESALTLAVLYRNIVAINVLLRAGANLNLYDKQGYNCLWMYIQDYRDETILNLLLDERNTIDPADLIHQSSKMQVGLNEEIKLKVFKQALKIFSNEEAEKDYLTKTDRYGNTIFHYLAFCNRIENIEDYPRELLNKVNNFGHSPLSLASSHDNIEALKALISLGATSHGQHAKYDPFTLALYKGCLKVVRYYLSLPTTDVNLSRIFFDLNLTPLMIAAMEGDIPVLLELLLHPNLDLKPESLDKAISLAKKTGHLVCAKLITLLAETNDFHLYEDNTEKFEEEIIIYLVKKMPQ